MDLTVFCNIIAHRCAILIRIYDPTLLRWDAQYSDTNAEKKEEKIKSKGNEILNEYMRPQRIPFRIHVCSISLLQNALLQNILHMNIFMYYSDNRVNQFKRIRYNMLFGRDQKIISNDH